ncbi:MAG: SGNH/GDSL hydrolase family protein [Myxococcota bacterium]
MKEEMPRGRRGLVPLVCGVLLSVAACSAPGGGAAHRAPSVPGAVSDATAVLNVEGDVTDTTRTAPDASLESVDTEHSAQERPEDSVTEEPPDADVEHGPDTHAAADASADIEPFPVLETIRILSLGDSYTVGSGGVPEAERWPNQLADALEVFAASQSEPLLWTLPAPDLIAQIGWTTTQLMAAMDEAGLATGEGGAHEGEPYGLVTLLIGVNNQFQGRPLEAYQEDLEVLLERAVALSAGRPERVVMVSIPDYGVTPFAAGPGAAAISAELDLFNAAAQVLAEEAGVHWVDIVDISRLAAEDASLLAADGLHPSGTMYTLWAERIEPVAVQALLSD